MTDVLATLDDSNPLEFWQKAIAAVPELESSAVAALASYIYIVIHNGVMKIYTPCWVATIVVPTRITFVTIFKALYYCPPLPAEGSALMTIGPKHFTTINLFDLHGHLIYTPCEGHTNFPLLQGTYSGTWKRLNRK